MNRRATGAAVAAALIVLGVTERALEAAVAKTQAESFLFPFGLFHSDHRLAHDAALIVLRRRKLAGFAYEDAIYRRYAGLLAAKHHEFKAAGIQLEPVPLPTGYPEIKRRALDGRAQVEAHHRGGAQRRQEVLLQVDVPEPAVRLELAVVADVLAEQQLRRVAALEELDDDLDQPRLGVLLASEPMSEEIELQVGPPIQDRQVVVEVDVRIGMTDDDAVWNDTLLLEDPQLVKPDGR